MTAHGAAPERARTSGDAVPKLRSEIAGEGDRAHMGELAFQVDPNFPSAIDPSSTERVVFREIDPACRVDQRVPQRVTVGAASKRIGRAACAAIVQFGMRGAERR